MIFHNDLNLDVGRVVDDNGAWQGFNILVSPTPLPPPTTSAAIELHLQKGAILIYLLHEPDLFGHANDRLALQRDSYGTQVNQRMLLLVADKEQRQIYQEPAREWMLEGGIAHVLPDVMDTGAFLSKLEKGVTVRDVSLVDWFSMLPEIDKDRAKKLVEEYGSRAIELFTISTDPERETVLRLPGFEGMSLAQLRRVRDFFELDSDKELRTFEVTEEEVEDRHLTREFYRLANELGGEVVES